MASGGARSLLAFWIGGASSTAAPPVVVDTARPVGIREHYEPRHYAPIRGKGSANLSGLLAYGRGTVTAPVKPKPRPAPVIGRASPAPLPGLRLAASGHVLTSVTGAGAIAQRPLTAAGTGRHDIFHDDQLAVINSMLALL